jgi:hypothetical protein
MRLFCFTYTDRPTYGKMANFTVRNLNSKEFYTFLMLWNWFTEKDREVEFYLKMCENTAYIEDKRGQCDGQSCWKGTKMIRKTSCVSQLHDISCKEE